jgi:hypothetical protein
MLVLLVSLGALLFAAAGVARYIWLRRGKPWREPSMAIEPAEESELEPNS